MTVKKEVRINSLKSLNRESAQVSKTDIFSIEPSLLLEEPGFNARGAFSDNYFERDDVAAHIRNLADAYTRGDYVPPIIVKVVEGKVFVRDGHCRRRALLLAMSEGAAFKKVQVLEHKGDEAAQTALIVTSNDGLALSQLERAVVYGKLSAWGWTDIEIATKVGRTYEHVRQLRQLLELPVELKRLIQEGTVSASYAAELFKEHGVAALDILNKAKTEAKGAKVTKKKVATKPRIGKKLVASMHSNVTVLTDKLETMKEVDGGYSITFSKTEVEELLALKDKLDKVKEASVGAEAKSTDDSSPEEQSELAI